MTAETYVHVMGGGPGEIIPPARLHETYADHWHVRCYRWCGSEYWAARRRHPVPDEAKAAGVADGWQGWSTAGRMRDWLERQNELWGAWASA